MKTRKILIILSIVLTAFLSVSGILMLNKLNADTSDPAGSDDISGVLDLDGSNGTDRSTQKPDFAELSLSEISKNKPVNILLVGSDEASGNTDTMIIINYDPKTAGLNLLSIPRDTKVTINERSRKINFAYPSGGSLLAKNVIWELLNITVDRYIYIDLSAFKDIIDLLGGVEYNVPVDMKYTDEAQGLFIDLKAGLQILDGEKAEQFMRFRHPNSYQGLSDEYKQYYNGSDLKRVDAQQDFIRELIRQKATVSNLPKILDIMDIIFDKMKTDLTLDEILGFIQNFDRIDIGKIKMFVLSGTDSIDNGAWFFNFNGKVSYNGETYPADKVVENYFMSNFD